MLDNILVWNKYPKWSIYCWKQTGHRVSFVFNHYLIYFYNFMVRILFIVQHLPVCVCTFVSVFEHAGLRGGCVHDVAFGENCVLYVLLCAEEGDRATRHGSGQECATWVGCTIELGSLRVVNGTGITPLHPPCWVMTTTQHYSCQVLFTATVKTCTLWEQTHKCTYTLRHEWAYSRAHAKMYLDMTWTHSQL